LRLRRPVEVLGLLHVVNGIGALRDDAGPEVFEAIRPDGNRRNFLVPAITLTPGEVATLDGWSLEGAGDE
jgi:hypothetical protein